MGSMVKDGSENVTYSSPDDTGSIEEKELPEDTILSRQPSINLVPFIGQRFVSQDAAYEFYCSFAKQCGFSIRRHRTRGKDGVGRGITRRDFTCHRGGFPQMKPSEEDRGKLQRNRKSSRCGCQAYMRIVKRADFNVPEWRVTGFSNIHNHEMIKPNEVRMLQAYCTMSADDKSRVCMFAKAGMSVRQMLRLLEMEKGVKIGCLPFTEIDVRNLLQSFRKVDRDNDTVDLLKLCKEKKDRDPYFKYDYEIDADNRLHRIAWSYASSISLYESFGDVVIFDTTHRLDTYDMLFGIWIGLDNHGMNCCFGCVLLRDENVQSLSWALKTFLDFMNERTPATILTDKNAWLKEAIAAEMPRTKHAFCIWHIISRFSDWFSTLLGSQYDNWKAEFHRLYSLHSVEEFEVGWREMVDTYRLHGNKHIVSLYALRTFWALPFLRSYFFAGMTSSFQAEKINAYIQRFLGAQSMINNYIEQVATVVNDEEHRTKQKMQHNILKISPRTGSPIESHAAAILTPYAFSKLQEELVLAPQYASLMVEENFFIVPHHMANAGGFKVLWVPHEEFISCSCSHFEFSGILCRHVLRVLTTNNCFRIPDQYLPVRWRDTSSSLSKLGHDSSSTDHTEKIQLLRSIISTLIAESTETEERTDVACDQISAVLARIKDLPGSSNCAVNFAYNSPSGSLILPDTEDSDVVAESFIESHQESLILSKLRERRLKDGADTRRKRRRTVAFHRQCGNDASDGPIIGAANLHVGGGLGFL